MSSLYLAPTVDDQRVVDQLAACQGMVKQAVGNGRDGVDWRRWMDPSTVNLR